MSDEEKRYPIGRLSLRKEFDRAYRQQCLVQLKALPGKIRVIQNKLTELDLLKVYRPGSWTVRQIIHHLADSHLMGYARIKHALTEKDPVVKLFEEADWALLADYSMPVDSSVRILEGIHQRMVVLLESLNDRDWEKAFIHPLSNAKTPLGKILDIYSWHGNHHLAQIELALAN